jgi:tripartite-type tricarboxylate transporter receptor subunit TctC
LAQTKSINEVCLVRSFDFYRRNFAAVVAALVCTIICLGGARAAPADYPARPITIIVPFAAGGGTDAQTRLIARALSERLRTPVVVDNRPGAAGRIGTALAARAAPDGYTLLVGTITTFGVEPAVRKDVGYDVARDFDAIVLATRSPMALVVNAGLGASNFAQLVAMARARPGTLSYGSPGVGSTAHFFTEVLKHSIGIDIQHIPYKGEAPAIVDIVGGQLTMMNSSIPAALSQLKAGKLRALAVTGTKRLPMFPNVPTLKELGVANMEFQAWWGFVAPKNTPPEIIARLSREFQAALSDPKLIAALEQQGLVADPAPPAAFAAQIKSQMEQVSRLVKAINFQIDD